MQRNQVAFLNNADNSINLGSNMEYDTKWYEFTDNNNAIIVLQCYNNADKSPNIGFNKEYDTYILCQICTYKTDAAVYAYNMYCNVFI